MKRYTTLTLPALALAAAACNSENFSTGGQRNGVKAGPKSADGSGDSVDAKNGNKTNPGEDKDGEDDVDRNASSNDNDSDLGQASSPELDADNSEFSCAKGQKGYAGKVYRLPPETPMLPALDQMTPIGQLDALQLNVAEKPFDSGFPGVPDLVEWFAIKFTAQLQVPTTGAYVFKTRSDDGSKLFLGDQVIVNNDGIHHVQDSESAPIVLQAGSKRRIRIDWYQGPRISIALQVYWKRPGSSTFEIIPAELLRHGKDCHLQDLGTFD